MLKLGVSFSTVCACTLGMIGGAILRRVAMGPALDVQIEIFAARVARSLVLGLVFWAPRKKTCP